MLLNILIPLEVLVHLNFVLSFKNPAELISLYETDEVVENKNNICQSNIIIKATACRRILQLLRHNDASENPYRNTLYMNYNALSINDNCEEKEILISEERLEKRPVLTCFSRLPVIYGSTNIENWPHINEISIYSGSNYSIVVLKCFVFCILLEWFQENELGKLMPIANELFILPVPQSIFSDGLEINYILSVIINRTQLLQMSYNENNIMLKMNGKEIENICYLMFNRSQYIHKFFNPPKRIKDAISGSKNIRRVNTMLNIFQQEKIGDRWIEIRLDTPAFPCNKFRETGIRHLAFKMMLGPTNTSVILLEPEDYQLDYNKFRKYNPIELVDYLEIYNIIEIDENY